MLTIDTYVALLEKRAMAESSIEQVDSAKETVDEYSQNQADNRSELEKLFNRASAVASDMSATAKKVWSSAEGTKIYGHPMLKMASRENFFASLEQQGLMKTASPLHKEVAYNAFRSELEKLASAKGL